MFNRDISANEMMRLVLYLLFVSSITVPANGYDMDKEECELHAPNTMHEFCCEIHDENSEFMECEIEWSKHISHTTEEDEMNYNFCVSECVLNKTNFLKPDRKSLRMNTIKLHLSELHGDEESEAMMLNAYEECSRHADHMLDNAEVKKLETRLDKYNCHPYPGLVFECVSNELILNCPPSKYHGTASCEHARNYLRACLKHKK